MALRGALALALASGANLAMADRTFVEQLVFDQDNNHAILDIYTDGPVGVTAGSTYRISAIGGEIFENGVSQGQAQSTELRLPSTVSR